MRTNVVLTQLLLEASAVAVAVEKDWSRLRSVAGRRLTEATPEVILGLVRAIRRAPLDARRRVGPPPVPVATRARALLRELRRAMDAYAQLRGDEVLRATLSRVEDQQPARAGSESALAAALELRVVLAEPLRDQLHGFGDFDAATIDRAREAVAELRALPAQRREARAKKAAQKAERDAQITELEDIIREVRAAARYVFRNEPEIARKFTSEHARRAQRAHRAKKRASTAGSTEP